MPELIEFKSEEIKAMVVHAVKDVCRTMLKTDVALVGSQSIHQGETSESPLAEYEDRLIFGNVGFVGIASGMVYIGMSVNTAKRLTMLMLGMSSEEVGDGHDLVNDVIGELTNMTSGAFKNQLCDRGYNCRLSIPSILRGKYFVVEGSAAEFREIYTFSFGDDVIVFELFMKVDENSEDNGQLA